MSESTDKDLPAGLPDEQQLDDYLRGGSAVSRQYRQLDSADVPAEIDRLVLRQAHEAVKIRPAKSRTWQRWSGPLALAASAVLVISIVIESGVHEETVLTAPASMPQELKPAAQAPENSASVPQAETREKKAMDSSTADATGSSVVPIVPVESSATTAPQFIPPQEVSQPQERAAVRQEIRPAAPDAPSAAAPAPKLELPPPEVTTEAPTATLSRDERVQQTYQQISRRPVAPVPAPAPALAQPPTSEPDISEVTVMGSRMRSGGEVQASPAMPAEVLDESESDAAEQLDESRSYLDPEQWLREIRELRKEKKHEEADREWRRFRSVYPNYTVAEKDLARGSTR